MPNRPIQALRDFLGGFLLQGKNRTIKDYLFTMNIAITIA